MACAKFVAIWMESEQNETCFQFDMMTSSNGNIFRVTGPLFGEFTCHRWIPLTKTSDAELWCFLWSASWRNGWVNVREAGDLRRHRAHYDVIVMALRWKTASDLDTWATLEKRWYQIIPETTLPWYQPDTTKKTLPLKFVENAYFFIKELQCRVQNFTHWDTGGCRPGDAVMFCCVVIQSSSPLLRYLLLMLWLP